MDTKSGEFQVTFSPEEHEKANKLVGNTPRQEPVRTRRRIRGLNAKMHKAMRRWKRNFMNVDGTVFQGIKYPVLEENNHKNRGKLRAWFMKG